MKNKKRAVYIALAVAAILIAALIPLVVASSHIVYVADAATIPETENLTGELGRICSCESTGDPNAEPRHYDDDGSVLAGRVVPADRGMCQINRTYWKVTADKLGFDIEEPVGNIRMAKYLYSKYGNAPWSASKKCWRK